MISQSKRELNKVSLAVVQDITKDKRKKEEDKAQQHVKEVNSRDCQLSVAGWIRLEHNVLSSKNSKQRRLLIQQRSTYYIRKQKVDSSEVDVTLNSTWMNTLN